MQPRDKNIFTLNPTSLDMKRSVFSRNSQHKTSFNLGELVPIYLDEVLPGDTITMDLSEVVRMGTPIAPIMDNLYADVYFFFVPNRLVWSHWQQFCGENDTTAWTQTTAYTIPVHDIGNSGYPVGVGSVGDHFGLPIGTAATGFAAIPNKVEVSELPLRAYSKIYNDWFRDENSIAPILYTIGDTANTAIKYSDSCYKVSRFHDMFSSALPAPQKGASVSLPLGTTAPILTSNSGSGITTNNVSLFFTHLNDSGVPSAWIGANFGTNSVVQGGFNSNGSSVTKTNVASSVNEVGGRLYADLQNATAATINALRTAFQVQKLLEKDARGGTRLTN